MSMEPYRKEFGDFNKINPFKNAIEVEQAIKSNERNEWGRAVRFLETKTWSPYDLPPYCTPGILSALFRLINDTQRYIQDYIPEAPVFIIEKVLDAKIYSKAGFELNISLLATELLTKRSDISRFAEELVGKQIAEEFAGQQIDEELLIKQKAIRVTQLEGSYTVTPVVERCLLQIVCHLQGHLTKDNKDKLSALGNKIHLVALKSAIDKLQNN